MTALNRRRFLEAAGALAVVAPLAGCTQAVRSTGDGAWLDAVSSANAVQSGRKSALTLVNNAIYRLNLVNDDLNAVALPNFDRARAEAAQGMDGPFAGVPTLIKDNLMKEGMPYTQGSRSLANFIAPQTAPFHTVIDETGMISIGRSTLPEFGMTATTEPLLTGVTRNPWNTGHSAGGSSGGSAAAVAAGVVPVAHANDGGGSIRIPAAACGLVGLKASRGRMGGEDDSDAATDLGIQGFVTRTVRDSAASFYAAQGGPLFPAAQMVTGPSDRRLRITSSAARSDGSLADPEVVRVLEETMALLARRGHRTGDADRSFISPQLSDDFMALWTVGAAMRLDSAMEMGGIAKGADLTEYFEPLMLGMAQSGSAYTEEEREAVVRRLEAFSAGYRAQFENTDVIVTPVLGQPPAPIGYISPTMPFEQQRARLSAYAGFTGAENVAGLPAIALPVGMSSGGLPIGLQFIGAPGTEPMLLALAYELENELLWYQRTPPIWVGGREAI
ncbi:MAG: amidase family protein [Pacificimonas sp.]|nr:amidase family protein [Pacificimonas sp.]